jgi:hypothetical protein
MIQKLNDRGGSAALAPHRENTSLSADGPEAWGSWYNRRFVLFVKVSNFASLTPVRHIGFTPWKLPKSPFEPGCVALVIKYANL